MPKQVPSIKQLKTSIKTIESGLKKLGKDLAVLMPQLSSSQSSKKPKASKPKKAAKKPATKKAKAKPAKVVKVKV